MDYDALLKEVQASMPDLDPVSLHEADCIRVLAALDQAIKSRARDDQARERRKKQATDKRAREASAERRERQHQAEEQEDAAAQEQWQRQVEEVEAEQEGAHVPEPAKLQAAGDWAAAALGEEPDLAEGSYAAAVQDLGALEGGSAWGQLAGLSAQWLAAALLSAQLGLAPAACPGEATSRAMFHAACSSSSPDAAHWAASSYLRWCGVQEVPHGGEALLDPAGLLDLEAAGGQAGAAAEPAASLWLPSAKDVLEALRALGLSEAGRAGPSSSRRPKKEGAAAAAAGSSGSATAGAHRMHNLQLLLRLSASVWRLAAGGRLQPSLEQGHGRQLLLALLQLQLDPVVRGSALPELQEATGALIEAFGPTEWQRVAASVADDLAQPLGPSHRSAVLLLRELPGSGARRWQLQQAGGVALMRKLLGAGAAAGQASPSRGRGASAAAAAAGPAQVQELLKGQGPGVAHHALRALMAPDAPDFWGVMSVLDAADIVLWAAVEQGNQLEVQHADVRAWFVRWLEDTRPHLRQVQWHFVRARISDLGKRVYASSAELCAAG